MITMQRTLELSKAKIGINDVEDKFLIRTPKSKPGWVSLACIEEVRCTGACIIHQ